MPFASRGDAKVRLKMEDTKGRCLVFYGIY